MSQNYNIVERLKDIGSVTRIMAEGESGLLVRAKALEDAASLIQELGEALETTKVCLNQALGIVVEFGDLNGFRNLSDQELGKAVVSMAERAARILNDADAILSKLKEA